MGNFSIIALGVGDAFSSCYYSSCLLLEAADQRLLIDCPHPIRKIFRNAGQRLGISLDIDSIDAILQTHLHADHSSGLEGFAYYNHFVLGKPKTKIIAHPEVLEHLWEGKLRGSMGYPHRETGYARTFEDFFEAINIEEGQCLVFGEFSIECHKTIHSIPTTAFRVSAGGRSLGYSADTSFCRELIDWLAEADLIVHETNYGPHTAYKDLAKLPASLRKKMRLIHYPDDFRLYHRAIEPLLEGHKYQI
jgi:ribonuclease BN (tRNA processing enzyme)